jgi:arabinogalactan endo-1,4-beta-galactosidase
VKYDVIGKSYYPWWHGSLNDLRENLTFMANEYHKDIMVVDAAYNWQPREYTTKPAPFPESGRAEGIPARGGRGFFDADGVALPMMTVFDKFTRH